MSATLDPTDTVDTDLQEGQEFIDLREDVCCEGLKLNVDRKAGIIRGVKVLGSYSPNEGGREYSSECRRGAIALLEGKKVNVNHVTPGSRRDYRDRNGFLCNIHEEQDGLYGDHRYNPHNALTPQLLWDAENAPGNVGFSIDARGRKRMKPDGSTLIEGLELVRSVDLVADPATTAGLFESLDPEDTTADLSEGELAKRLDLEEQESRRWRLCETTCRMVRKALEDQLTSVDDKRQKVIAVLGEWAVEAKKLLASVGDASVSSPEKTGYGPMSAGVPMSPLMEGSEMDLEKLTLAELKEKRADLIESILADTTKAAELAGLQAEVTALKARVTTLQESLAGYQKKEREAQLESEIQEDLKSAKSIRGMKLDPANKTHVSESFLVSLRSAATPEARKLLIADRLDLLESVVNPTAREGLPFSPSSANLQEDRTPTAKRDPVERQRAWSAQPIQ